MELGELWGINNEKNYYVGEGKFSLFLLLAFLSRSSSLCDRSSILHPVLLHSFYSPADVVYGASRLLPVSQVTVHRSLLRSVSCEHCMFNSNNSSAIKLIGYSNKNISLMMFRASNVSSSMAIVLLFAFVPAWTIFLLAAAASCAPSAIKLVTMIPSSRRSVATI